MKTLALALMLLTGHEVLAAAEHAPQPHAPHVHHAPLPREEEKKS